MGSTELEIVTVDPSSPEALALTRQMSEELSLLYDGAFDGSFGFQPEDALVPRSAFVIGRNDGRAVACGAILPLEDGVAEIKRMFVAPEWRGRGYAAAVLAKLEQLARDNHYTVIRLETGDRQPHAIRLYERAGYSRISISNDGGALGFEKRLAEK